MHIKNLWSERKNITTSLEIIFSFAQCLTEYYTAIQNIYTMIIITIYYLYLGIGSPKAY
jgi:hypothetical protein